MIPTTPYLIRAIYDWCSDQGFTPHLLVDASQEGVVVPRQLVENGSIVLNIQASAVKRLDISNEWVLFNARFSGKAMDISVPVTAVRAIFARENGKGCAFEPAPIDTEQQGDESADLAAIEETNQPKKSKRKAQGNKSGVKRSHLKLVD